MVGHGRVFRSARNLSIAACVEAVSLFESVSETAKASCASVLELYHSDRAHPLTEISSYNILLAAAESAGDAETQQVCDTIRRQVASHVSSSNRNKAFLKSAT